MLPKGWEVKHLSEIADINPRKSSCPKDNLVSFVPMDAVSEAAQLIRTEVRFYSEVEKGFTSFCDKDVLLAKITPCFENGKGAHVTGLVNGIGFGSTEFHVLRAKKKICAEFLYYVTNTKEFRVRGEANMQGSAGQKRVPTDYLKEYKVFTPQLPEQIKIAEILSTWDNAINTVQKLLANSQQQKKALMQQLLTGKKRFSGFEGEWSHGCLADVCSLKGGSAFKEEYQGVIKGDFPFIKVSDMNLIGNEKYINQSNNWVTKETAILMKAKAFPAGAIVFAKVGAALLLNRRRILSQQTIVDNNMMAAIPSKFGDTDFLYQVLLSVDFARLVQDGAVPSINQSALASFRVSYPELAEQQKIATILTTADQEIDNLRAQLNHLKQEKKALMQQLLTGKRRVKVEEAA